MIYDIKKLKRRILNSVINRHKKARYKETGRPVVIGDDVEKMLDDSVLNGGSLWIV